MERGREDRHQFRFNVAPEDGDRLSNLRAFTRDVMRQMADDLRTRLDWVAVDHFNTGHPHSHVVIRGKDDTGKDLIIAQDYIKMCIRDSLWWFCCKFVGRVRSSRCLLLVAGFSDCSKLSLGLS